MGKIVERISLGLNGEDANGVSQHAVVSANGRYIAFESTASNLVAGDTNGVADIFRYDTVTRETIRVSVGTDGGQSNSASAGATISADGRYVAFDTVADNLVTRDYTDTYHPDTNGLRDVFMRDINTGSTLRISERFIYFHPDGQAAGGTHGSYNAAILVSATYGPFVAFVSDATNLLGAGNDTNGTHDIFLKSLSQPDQPYLMSDPNAGGESTGFSGPYVSAEYRVFNNGVFDVEQFFFAYSSQDPTKTQETPIYDVGSPPALPEGYPEITDTQAFSVYLSDSENAALASRGTGGVPALGHSLEASTAWPYVLYTSTASNISGGLDTNGVTDVYLYNYDTQTSWLVSVGLDGLAGNGASGHYARVALDANQRPIVTFSSAATNLVTGDTNGQIDFFVRDVFAGTTTRLSERAHGGEANGESQGFATGGGNISNGTKSFVFTSTATNLVDGDSNGFGDIFQVRMVDEATVVASRGTTASKEQIAKAIDATVMLADADSATVTSAEVAITGNFRAGQDLLQFTNTSAIQGSYNATTGVLTLTALSGTPDIATFEAALRSVKYLNTSNTPDTIDRTITFTMDSTTGDASAAKVLSVAAINDTPADLRLVGATVKEFRATGTVVGTLSAVDVDSSVFTYSLTNNAGGRFAIAGNKLVVANGVGLDYEQAKSHVVQIKVTDQGGLARVENFTIAVGNVDPETVNGNAFANRILGGAKSDVLNGLGGADTLIGGIGNDTLRGGLGNDTLQGGIGRDVLTGGENNDIFKFVALTDSRGATMDIITDFDDPGKGDDRIDLSAVYGGTLTYIHGAGFSKAGQVRINDIAGPNVIVEVYAGGTLGVDFSIRLAGTTLASMTKSDFVL